MVLGEPQFVSQQPEQGRQNLEDTQRINLQEEQKTIIGKIKGLSLSDMPDYTTLDFQGDDQTEQDWFEEGSEGAAIKEAQKVLDSYGDLLAAGKQYESLGSKISDKIKVALDTLAQIIQTGREHTGSSLVSYIQDNEKEFLANSKIVEKYIQSQSNNVEATQQVADKYYKESFIKHYTLQPAQEILSVLQNNDKQKSNLSLRYIAAAINRLENVVRGQEDISEYDRQQLIDSLNFFIKEHKGYLEKTAVQPVSTEQNESNDTYVADVRPPRNLPIEENWASISSVEDSEKAGVHNLENLSDGIIGETFTVHEAEAKIDDYNIRESEVEPTMKLPGISLDQVIEEDLFGETQARHDLRTARMEAPQISKDTSRETSFFSAGVDEFYSNQVQISGAVEGTVKTTGEFKQSEILGQQGSRTFEETLRSALPDYDSAYKELEEETKKLPGIKEEQEDTVILNGLNSKDLEEVTGVYRTPDISEFNLGLRETGELPQTTQILKAPESLSENTVVETKPSQENSEQKLENKEINENSLSQILDAGFFVNQNGERTFIFDTQVGTQPQLKKFLIEDIQEGVADNLTSDKEKQMLRNTETLMVAASLEYQNTQEALSSIKDAHASLIERLQHTADLPKEIETELRGLSKHLREAMMFYPTYMIEDIDGDAAQHDKMVKRDQHLRPMIFDMQVMFERLDHFEEDLGKIEKATELRQDITGQLEKVPSQKQIVFVEIEHALLEKINVLNGKTHTHSVEGIEYKGEKALYSLVGARNFIDAVEYTYENNSGQDLVEAFETILDMYRAGSSEYLGEQSQYEKRRSYQYVQEAYQVGEINHNQESFQQEKVQGEFINEQGLLKSKNILGQLLGLADKYDSEMAKHLPFSPDIIKQQAAKLYRMLENPEGHSFDELRPAGEQAMYIVDRLKQMEEDSELRTKMEHFQEGINKLVEAGQEMTNVQVGNQKLTYNLKNILAILDENSPVFNNYDAGVGARDRLIEARGNIEDMVAIVEDILQKTTYETIREALG